MIGSRAVFRWLAVALIAALLTFGLMPAALAQYSIPDCMVAASNNLLNDADYYAGRDISYKEISHKWSAYTAELTPAQLEGYTAYVCAHLTVVDLGKDAELTWHWRLDYPSIEDYMATIGHNGGGSNNSGSTSDNNGETTNITGDEQKNSAASIPFAPSENVVFLTSFDDLPAQIELRDENGDAFEPTFQVQAGGSLLHVRGNNTRSIYLAGADGWTDYAVEARVRIKNGLLVLSARMADDDCSSYAAYLNPNTHTANLSVSDSHCKSTALHSQDDVNLRANHWTTVRFEVVADQLSLYVDGAFVLVANDTTYTKGFPALSLLPDSGTNATLDIDWLQVLALNTPPETLTDYAAAPGVAIAELQALGKVPAGQGQLVFAEPLAYFNGTGRWFQPLATSAPRSDIVMAGTLTFTPGDSYFSNENCTLMARIVMQKNSNTTAQQLEVGFDDTGSVFVRDIFSQRSLGTEFRGAYVGPFEPGQTHHLLFTLFGLHLVAYVDGKSKLDVNFAHDRVGTFGLGLTGKGPKAHCDGRNIWVYSFR